MSEVATTSRTGLARSMAWVLFAAVPVLAIVTLGSGVYPGSTNATPAPATASLEDTREFSRLGDDLAALTGAKADTDDAALTQWQNTVTRRPSPRR